MENINHNKLIDFCNNILLKSGCNEVDSEYVAKGLVHASLRGIDSHGIRLFPHYIKGLQSGRISKNPKYSYTQGFPSCTVLNADNAFGMAAGIRASRKAVEIAETNGVGIVSVCGSSHFGAASYYGIDICKNNMIGMSMTHSDSLIVPTGAKRSFTGNNPICFTAPGLNNEFFCLDMATSTITFNKVMQYREEKKELPDSSGIDKDGLPTNDPFKAVALMPVGGYKGYGLAVMVEILCSLLSNVPFGPHLVKMYDDDIHMKRNLGQFFMAININAFLDEKIFKERLTDMMSEIRGLPLNNDSSKVLVAGDPELEVEKVRIKNGIPLREIDIKNLTKISEDYNISLV